MKNNRLSQAFAIIGILCLLLSFGVVLYNLVQDSKSGTASLEIVRKIEEKIPNLQYATNYDIPNEIPSTDLFKEFESQENNYVDNTITIDGNRYLGIIFIPILDLELPVLNELNKDNLKVSPCKYNGTLDNNDLIIAGHNYKSHFGSIQSLNSGDTILFIDVNGIIHTYEVIQSEIIQDTDIDSMLSNSSTWDLTLFTCTLSGSSRITVRAISADN